MLQNPNYVCQLNAQKKSIMKSLEKKRCCLLECGRSVRKPLKLTKLPCRSKSAA
ncbi:hypothetical protein HanHA300_Chr17g0663961 [Helianthus annuus]|nr:hypothetical protein HanHA300_Chr17g0663961 [Helianthus annuus]